MTRQDLIKLDSRKVRNDERLMAFYLQEFEKVFARKPNCAGCTFKNDWKKFKQKVLTGGQTVTKSKIMATEKKSFVLYPKHANTIFTYLEKKRPVRSYGYKMTEEFAKKLLSTGTKEQIAERKKAFKVLPGAKPAAKEDPKDKRKTEEEAKAKAEAEKAEKEAQEAFEKAKESGELTAEQLDEMTMDDIKAYADDHKYGYDQKAKKDDLVDQVAEKKPAAKEEGEEQDQ